MKRVAIVICNYNKEDKVLECIQCILEQRYDDYDIYVVDNASTDNSVKKITDTYQTLIYGQNAQTDDTNADSTGAHSGKINLIINSENLGGSGGFNTGLRIAFEKGYEYLMCVDNDAMLDENAVGSLVEFLDTHEEVGMAASKIYHSEAPDYIQQFGQKIDFNSFCTEVPHLNKLEDGSMPDFLYVDSVAACSLMIRHTTIEKIGLMPEENFLYWDDTEWCYLCNRAGMKVASVGASKALHAMGAKREDVNTFPTYYAWRNWIRFFSKYTPEKDTERMAETFLGSVFGEVYAGIHRGEYNRLKTVMFAYDDAIHGVTGKAGKGRIFEVDRNFAPFEKMFSSYKHFYIEENHYHGQAEYIRSLPQQLGIDGIKWADAPANGVKTIHLCENIFRIQDTSLAKIYIDIDNCILQDENDALDLINYNYSRRAFVTAQKPVFISCINDIRKR